jgi:adenylate cyclase
MAESRKIAAILAADVVGFSRMASADEDGTLARLRTLRSELIDPAVASQNGRVFKRTGDGALVEFRSVVEAVRCAIAVQKAMIERNAGVPPERRIDFRIGIHLGDVVEESDGDLMGDGVNIAARLEGIAEPGAICLSEDAYRQVSGRLDMEVTDLGPTQLKNIARLIRAYSLQVGVAAQAKPALAAESAIQAKPPALKRRPGQATLAVVLAALAVVIAGSAWWLLDANWPAGVTANAPAEAARLSIVVLPFANLSGDPGQDYLVDALTDELTTSLARLRDSFVIAHNTAMTFKGKPIDVQAIGKELSVRYVLEGSVQPSGDRMRINAQLIDAGSGAHLWAEQFDTPRADLLQMQDAIVTHLGRAMEVTLGEAEAARLKRTPVANPDAEDLALQCQAALHKAGFVGKEADAGYSLCERALAIDPNNVRALVQLPIKLHLALSMGTSADPSADIARADELVSRALALDPTSGWAHGIKAWILYDQGRFEEAIAERERSLALDPANVGAVQGMAWDNMGLGRFDKGLELFDEAIRLGPRDPTLHFMYTGKSWAYFGLKRYDQAIDWARRAIAVNTSYHEPYAHLTVALALSGHEAEARQALQRYLALPSSERLRTIAAWKRHHAQFLNWNTDPRVLESYERQYDGLRKAGMPEQ